MVGEPGSKAFCRAREVRQSEVSWCVGVRDSLLLIFLPRFTRLPSSQRFRLVS